MEKKEINGSKIKDIYGDKTLWKFSCVFILSVKWEADS